MAAKHTLCVRIAEEHPLGTLARACALRMINAMCLGSNTRKRDTNCHASSSTSHRGKH